jgi:predicted O-methyltransferase YrrM
MAQDFAALISGVDAECRRLSIPMIGPQKAARLVELVQEAKPKRVLEIGTGIGYSGLWIAHTLHGLGQGHLVTVEKDPERARQAGAYFRRAGLEQWITQWIGDATELMGRVEGPIDLLFLDGGFANYYPCFMKVRRALGEGALLVADNAGIGANEMADYLEYVRRHYPSRTEGFDTDLPWNPRDAMEISLYEAGPGHDVTGLS